MSSNTHIADRETDVVKTNRNFRNQKQSLQICVTTMVHHQVKDWTINVLNTAQNNIN